MGFGLPSAIGAKIGRPDLEVWAVIGDGGFQMSSNELATAVQENLDINIAIINNGYLGMVRQWQDLFHAKNYSEVKIGAPNFENWPRRTESPGSPCAATRRFARRSNERERFGVRC